MLTVEKVHSEKDVRANCRICGIKRTGDSKSRFRYTERMGTTTRSTALLLGILAVAGACVSEGFEDTGSDEGGEGEEYGETQSAVETTPVYPTARPRIYLGPNKARLKNALAASTPTAVAFKTKVDQWLGGTSIWGFQAWNGALMGQLTGNTSYCTKAVSTVEAQVKDAEAKIASGVVPVVAHDSYLHIGELVGDLALVYDWCYAQVTTAQRTRWIAYANQAITNVWNPTTAKWGGKSFPWSGWSINNPSNNYYYSFLRATMLVGLATKGENAAADGFLTTFRSSKIINQLVPTFNADLYGGASREGTGYGVAMRRLFELYDFWKASTTEDLATKTGHTRASMLAMIHQTMPTLDRVAPAGDQSRDSTAMFYDYHRDYLLELMTLFPSDTLSKRAKFLLASSTVTKMSAAFMVGYDFLHDNPAITPSSLTGLNTTYFARGIGQVYSRSGWDKAATWVNLTAGAYTESHAHQDQGSIMIFKGGWLAYDPVIHSKSGLPQETTAHSLVRIDNGTTPIKQIASTVSRVTALQKTAQFTYTAADLTPAYKGHTSIQKVVREMVHLQPNIVVVADRVTTSTGTTQTWQLATPTQPTISGNTATVTNAGHTLKVTRMLPTAATTSVTSYAATNADFTGGFRIDHKVAGGTQNHLNVLSVDGAVTSTVANGFGVTLNLATGGQAIVKFNATAGGTITIGGVTTAFATTVNPLAE